MSVFMLDTDSVSSAKSSMDSIVSQIDSIASSVSSYDTSCDDFDFSSAKSVIASNIEAFGVKIKNTSAVMDSVVSSHTTLQNSLKFQSTEEKVQEQAQQQQENGYSNGYTYSPGYVSSSSSSGGYRNSASSSSKRPVVSNETTTDTSDVREITTRVSKVDHQVVDTNSITADAKDIFDKIEYNEAGYALFGGMFVIACSTTFGKVGEILEFTMKDGSKVRCIVGQTLEDAEGEIRFFVNDQWKEDGEDNVPNDFVDQIDKIHNYGESASGSTNIDLTKLPAIGEYTSKWSVLDDEWTVVTTKISVPDYLKVIASNHITQNSDTEKYGDYCLAFAYVHASNMYNGVTTDTNVSAGNYKHASEFSSFYSDSKTETLQKIYSEILQGRPVVMQVNGNKAGTSRHFVTVVGFRNSITDPSALTEEDLLIVDSWDGKVERMDLSSSRFMTTGSQTGKKYSGYYLRTLKA